MKNLSLKTIIKNLNGTMLQGNSDLTVNNFVTRIYRLKNNSLFFDLYKNQFSSPPASDNVFSSCAVITDNPNKFKNFSKSLTIIHVRNIDKAYWKFVECYRNQFDIPVIGVTGTCGKTTTKEMINHILSQKLNVVATYKSYNAAFRHLGYLLKINDDTQAAVLEMGVAYPNDLTIACKYFKPQVGVVTNIGVDHLEGFGSIDSYINGKSEFLKGLQNKGTLVLNADSDYVHKIDLSSYKGKVVYFGYSNKSHFRILNVTHIDSGLDFVLQYKEEQFQFFIPLHAEFNIYNATAAIAAAHAVGLSIKEAGESLRSYKNVEKHFELKKGINNSVVIDDTWSTNPTSLTEAIKRLKQISGGKKTIAALGKMSLLGKKSKEYHYKVGKIISEIGIDSLLLIDPGSWEIGLGALNNGMSKDNIHFCKNFDEVFYILNNTLNENSILLVKTTMLGSYKDLVDNITI